MKRPGRLVFNGCNSRKVTRICLTHWYPAINTRSVTTGKWKMFASPPLGWRWQQGEVTRLWIQSILSPHFRTGKFIQIPFLPRRAFVFSRRAIMGTVTDGNWIKPGDPWQFATEWNPMSIQHTQLCAFVIVLSILKPFPIFFCSFAVSRSSINFSLLFDV